MQERHPPTDRQHRSENGARHTAKRFRSRRHGAGWIRSSVSFVDSEVDRITPRTTADDVETVARLTGLRDECPVVTEPFTEWVLAGSFPAGRPAWEHAGAAFVDDVTPYEERKLWLLNGAHSLLAYAGSITGHETVAGQVRQPAVRQPHGLPPVGERVRFKVATQVFDGLFEGPVLLHRDRAAHPSRHGTWAHRRGDAPLAAAPAAPRIRL